MLTLQEIFNRAYLGVVNQGRMSASGLSCKYRLKTGDGEVLKCGVGHLIPDEAYSPDFDLGGGMPIDKLCGRADFVIKMMGAGIDLEHHDVLELLGRIQVAHDDASGQDAPMSHFKWQMRYIAQKHGLEVP